MRMMTSIAILAVSAIPALADRQVAEDERAKLVAAVRAEGMFWRQVRDGRRRSAVRGPTMRYVRMERNMTSSSICRCG